MKKRIAFLGTSYPLMYTMIPSEPESRIEDRIFYPILDNINGLVLLYDELWFSSRSLCPIKVQRLPFVRFVDEMYKDINYASLKRIVKKHSSDLEDIEFYPSDFVQSVINLNVSPRVRRMLLAPMHTGAKIRIGKYSVFACPSPENYLLDVLALAEIQRRSTENIELVSNIMCPLDNPDDYGKDVILTNQIIIDKIPSRITPSGPMVTDDILSLRDSEYLSDFRSWICENHDHIQKAEITEMQKYVQTTVDNYRNEVYLKALSFSNTKSVFLSSSKTLVTTAAGFIPIVGPYISAAAAGETIFSDTREALLNKDRRWSGFIVQAEELGRKRKKDSPLP